MRKATISAQVIQNHRRRDGVCELFVNANQFVFQGAAAIRYVVNLPSGRPGGYDRAFPARYLIGCGLGWFGCIIRPGWRGPVPEVRECEAGPIARSQDQAVSFSEA